MKTLIVFIECHFIVIVLKKYIGASIAILGVFAYSLAEEAEKKAKKGMCVYILMPVKKPTNACEETY